MVCMFSLEKGRTEFAAQMKLSEMHTSQTDSPDALPPPTSSSRTMENHHGPSGAKRFEQVGLDVSTKILDSCMDGVDLGGFGAWLLIDVCPGSAEFLEAFLVKRGGIARPGYCFGLCADAESAEWAQSHLAHKLSDMVVEGTLIIPGLTPPSTELPASLMATKPEPPALHVLLLDEQSKTYNIPEHVIQKWGLHDVYASQLDEILKKVGDELGYGVPLEAAASQIGNSQNNKRPVQGGPSPNKPKLPHTTALNIVPNVEMPWLLTVAMDNVKGQVCGQVETCDSV